MARRLKEFEKQLTARVKRAARTIEKYFTEEAARRAEKLRAAAGGDPNAVREKVALLYKSLDERTAELKNEVKPFLKREMAAFPPVDPAAVYKAYLRNQADSDEPALRDASGRALKRFEARKAVARDDLAALGLIALRMTEVKKPDARHLVIDEAQDFSALEFALLNRLAPGATVTAVGDLMQSIGAGGITGWDEPPSLGRAVRRELTVSYRSTVEIMRMAEAVFARHPAPGIAVPKTVLRHGDEPVVEEFKNRAALGAAVDRIARAWQDQGMSSIAVIGRSEAALRELLKALPRPLGAKLLSADDPEALSGVMLASAAAVKGLEFDAVILADAGVDAFPDDPRSARLLYVCLTRALHKLAVLHEGPLTPLLSER
jgi:DNA helicase-2/ATP-dependent DNA helicase PcrA